MRSMPTGPVTQAENTAGPSALTELRGGGPIDLMGQTPAALKTAWAPVAGLLTAAADGHDARTGGGDTCEGDGAHL